MPVSPGQHIALVGFMGCGKSTVGPRLAQKLGLPFVDTDRVVEKTVGASIPEIFDRQGEQAFRDLESAALRATVSESPRVIATGGGLPVRDENWQLLERFTVPIWLRVSWPDLAERLRLDTDRPLLRDDPGLTRAQSLYVERERLYKRAPVWVNAAASPIQVVKEIVARLQNGPYWTDAPDGVE